MHQVKMTVSEAPRHVIFSVLLQDVHIQMKLLEYREECLKQNMN